MCLCRATFYAIMAMLVIVSNPATHVQWKGLVRSYGCNMGSYRTIPFSRDSTELFWNKKIGTKYTLVSCMLWR